MLILCEDEESYGMYGPLGHLPGGSKFQQKASKPTSNVKQILDSN